MTSAWNFLPPIGGVAGSQVVVARHYYYTKSES